VLKLPLRDSQIRFLNSPFLFHPSPVAITIAIIIAITIAPFLTRIGLPLTPTLKSLRNYRPFPSSLLLPLIPPGVPLAAQNFIMVADAVVYHPTVSHYLKFVATTVGRDKLLRTIQYFARFYSWYLFRTNGSKTEIAPWDALKRQFGLARKVFRAGKNIEHLKAAAVAADNKTMDPVLRYATVGRQLGYAGYLSCDLATLLDALGVRKSERAKTLQREAYRFWAVGILCSIVAQLYTLHILRRREARVDKKEGEGVVESKKIAM